VLPSSIETNQIVNDDLPEPKDWME